MQMLRALNAERKEKRRKQSGLFVSGLAGIDAEQGFLNYPIGNLPRRAILDLAVFALDSLACLAARILGANIGAHHCRNRRSNLETMLVVQLFDYGRSERYSMTSTAPARMLLFLHKHDDEEVIQRARYLAPRRGAYGLAAFKSRDQAMQILE